MADPDSVPLMENDPQDMAEIFDETRLDDEGDGEALLDEMEDVYDATRERGQIYPSRLTPNEREQDPRLKQLESLADDILGEAHRDEDDDDAESPVADNEINLVYNGLMRNQRGAQASAAHWEARKLSDDDLRDLGYAASASAPTGENIMSNYDDPEGPHIRLNKDKAAKPDQLKKHLKDAEDRQEALIDEAVEESMDASDPPSPKHIT